MAETPATDIAHQRGGHPLHSPSSGAHTAQTITSTTTTTMNAAPLYKSSNGVESIFSNGWDRHAALPQNIQNMELRGSAMGSHSPTAISPYSVGMIKNRGGSNSSHILQYPLDPSLLEASPKLSSFGSGSFTSMVGSFGIPEYDQITNASCPDYLPAETGIHSNPREVNDHGAMFHGDLHISNEGGSGLSPNAKRKKRVHENSAAINRSQIQTGEVVDHQRDVCQESIEKLNERDSKKQKIEKNPGPNSRGKSNGKQTKDCSENEQSAKVDYIHVRAGRGQATNSHSLAERVRREKISQRMKYLQDLVPGCDKITGKALMLDEIINYVQSLQRQVEFLSMKLSTVNPDLNIDIERIMSKDCLSSQVGASSILGFGSGNPSHCMPHLISQGVPQAIHCTDTHLHPIQQMHPTWDDELHNIIQMGIMHNSSLDAIGMNGKVGKT